MTPMYSETQRFSFFGAKLILIAIFLTIGAGAVRQIVFGITFGNNPMGNTGLALLTVFVGLMLLGAYTISLKTVITPEQITVSFFPLMLRQKVILWKDIEKVYLRDYSALGEYGGWGVRIAHTDVQRGNGGKALITAGNQGLQLVLTKGERLLIGTQTPQKLEAFLREIGRIQ